MLSVAIIAAGIMLLQSTPANAENLTLTVTAAAGAGCTAGTDLSAGSVASSYDAQSTTGTFGSAFICTGTSATESTYTLSSTDVV
ncbi:hypothetical protein KKG31_02295 [Patescibacteria group bacterium]|nr:hypothetical protein [Patescibacteria group bacterium]MBU1758000.1 hypothetical protein [Patescibacteria group bacterium]